MLRKTQKHLSLFYAFMPRLLSQLTALHSRQRNMKNLANNLSYREADRSRTKAHPKGLFKRIWLFERILLVITVLGLACISLGLLLHVAGKALNDFDISRVGVYILLIGIALVATRIFYWIAEGIVKRGLESMTTER